MKANTSRSHKRFTHTAYQQPENVARVFPFILEAKHKTLHVYELGLSWKILQKNNLHELQSIESNF